MWQLNGEFEAKDENMRMYLQRMKEALKKIKVNIDAHSQVINIQKDSLAQLASSVETFESQKYQIEIITLFEHYPHNELSIQA